MRENTGRRTVSTVNFVNGQASVESVWTAKQAEEAEWLIEDMAAAHMAVAEDFSEAGAVWFYDCPGLYVWALTTNGVVDTVITVSEDDLLRVTTAIRTGREMSIRYVKESGEVSRRRVRPQSLRRTKAGDYVVRAEDDRRDGDTRSFRFDRITHTTLHHRVRRAAPTKTALVAAVQAAPAPAVERVPFRGYDDSQTAAWDALAAGSADERAPLGTLYDTRPDSPAALEADMRVSGILADAHASGRRYVTVFA